MENDRPISQGQLEELIDSEFLAQFPYSFLEKFLLLPLKSEDGIVQVAVSLPLLLDKGELELFFHAAISFLPARSEDILFLLEKYYYHPTSSQKILQELDSTSDSIVDEISEDSDDLLEFANQAPIIRLVNQIIYRAVSMRASDIHLQTLENDFKVRYRIDGVLHDIFLLPKKYQAAIISRVKIISDLDIAEKRIPQDGRTSIKADSRQIDIRVSIIPTFFGESAVLRLLDKGTFILDMAKLGLLDADYSCFDHIIKADHGIILLTGPTGSGKTTTLYTALSVLNNPKVNIITLEDPVEYQLPSINQIQINPRAGLTFAAGFRSILRHDPDIIMVGEIRDLETAEMAIQASLTGHLVFSTLHTNDAASAFTRLLDMGIEPFLIASSVNAIIAQRLIRLICPECGAPADYSASLLQEISIACDQNSSSTMRMGKGCSHCLQTGYYGRTGIFEILLSDDTTRELVMKRSSSLDIRKHALKKGMKTLRMDGARKVCAGLTSVAEILRVTQEI
jgi:general secretion pathway protein E